MENKIRKLRQSHYEASLQLSEYAFQYEVPEEKRKNRLEQLNKQEVYGIFNDEILTAKLHLLPLEIWLGEESFSMGGIAGVATYPEYRRKGYIRSLISHSLEHMKNQGMSLSMLHPFNIDFYRKFGWEIFAYIDKLYLKKKDLQPMKVVKGEIKRFNKATYPNALHDIYDQYSRNHNGMLVRTEDWWKERSITDLWIAIYYDEGMVPQGYISYEVKNEKMKVEEFIPLTSAARQGLWNYICQHDSMINEAELVLNPQEPLPYLLKDPRVIIEKHPYFMSRIVVVERFLNSYLSKVGFDECLQLSIKDHHAVWNNRTYKMDNHEVKEGNPSESSVVMNINTFTALIFGVHTPQALHAMGQIEGKREDVSKLTKLTQPYSPFFYDFF
ncbi:GNAT family N-acetyltransferase [Mangrovibacillus sp. Mu-81]|uniref:GNAT family N-acetyltransferase n=1 Tax=Mangrovibacillus sp. Mu-81 TaxID=3121478 RepID=UPI002FE469C2